MNRDKDVAVRMPFSSVLSESARRVAYETIRRQRGLVSIVFSRVQTDNLIGINGLNRLLSSGPQESAVREA